MKNSGGDPKEMLKMAIDPEMCMKTKGRRELESIDPGILMKINKLFNCRGEAGISLKRKAVNARIAPGR